MCERRGMGDGQGASWWLGFAERTQEAQDIMYIQYMLAMH